MKITADTLVSDILDARPDAVEVFKQYGVDPELECNCVLDNPLELCETMCGVWDIEGLMRDLQALFDRAAPR